MKNKLIKPLHYMTHRVSFEEVAREFNDWLEPEYGVIKAMVSF